MELPDFVVEFNTIYTARLFDGWQRHHIAAEWRGDSAAGCCRHAGWRRNPCVALSLPQDSRVFAVLSQRDPRVPPTAPAAAESAAAANDAAAASVDAGILAPSAGAPAAGAAQLASIGFVVAPLSTVCAARTVLSSPLVVHPPRARHHARTSLRRAAGVRFGDSHVRRAVPRRAGR